MEIVKVYLLLDPSTCKVRYIGVTTKSLEYRLRKHIDSSLWPKKGTVTHKTNWINSLLKTGKSPIIKQLTSIEGWKNALKLEKELINKYKLSRNLTNTEEYKEGGVFGRKLTEEQRLQASRTTKSWYEKGNIPGTAKKIKYFNKVGELLGTFDTITQACNNLNISHRHISLVLRGEKEQVKGYIFRYINDDKIVVPTEFDHHWATKKSIKVKNIQTQEIMEYKSQTDLVKDIGISHGLIYHHIKNNKGLIKSKNIQIL